MHFSIFLRWAFSHGREAGHFTLQHGCGDVLFYCSGEEVFEGHPEINIHALPNLVFLCHCLSCVAASFYFSESTLSVVTNLLVSLQIATKNWQLGLDRAFFRKLGPQCAAEHIDQ